VVIGPARSDAYLGDAEAAAVQQAAGSAAVTRERK
jgi:hypothetical protein